MAKMKLTIEEIKKLRAGIIPGPWKWFGSKHTLYLAATHSGRKIVMDFVRRGMGGAQPRFQIYLGENKAMGIMEKAELLAVKKEYGHEEWLDLPHPDARFIAAAPDIVDSLLERVAVLERALEKLKRKNIVTDYTNWKMGERHVNAVNMLVDKAIAAAEAELEKEKKQS